MKESVISFVGDTAEGTDSKLSKTTWELEPPIPEDDIEATHFPSGAASSAVIGSN